MNQLRKMSTPSVTRVLIVAVGLLLIPLIAMQFTDEVAWTASDFVVAGGLLFATGMFVRFGLTKPRTSTRVLLSVIGVVAIALLWGFLATGD